MFEEPKSPSRGTVIAAGLASGKADKRRTRPFDSLPTVGSTNITFQNTLDTQIHMHSYMRCHTWSTGTGTPLPAVKPDGARETISLSYGCTRLVTAGETVVRKEEQQSLPRFQEYICVVCCESDVSLTGKSHNGLCLLQAGSCCSLLERKRSTHVDGWASGARGRR